MKYEISDYDATIIRNLLEANGYRKALGRFVPTAALIQPLDLDGPLETKSGIYTARIVDRKFNGDQLLIILTHKGTGTETTVATDKSGIIGVDCNYNLVNPVPEKKTLWLNIYDTWGVACRSRDYADQTAGLNRTACVEVTYTKGEGL